MVTDLELDLNFDITGDSREGELLVVSGIELPLKVVEMLNIVWSAAADPKEEHRPSVNLYVYPFSTNGQPVFPKASLENQREYFSVSRFIHAFARRTGDSNLQVCSEIKTKSGVNEMYRIVCLSSYGAHHFLMIQYIVPEEFKLKDSFSDRTGDSEFDLPHRPAA